LFGRIKTPIPGKSLSPAILQRIKAYIVREKENKPVGIKERQKLWPPIWERKAIFPELAG
jgi:hypothetical protein